MLAVSSPSAAWSLGLRRAVSAVAGRGPGVAAYVGDSASPEDARRRRDLDDRRGADYADADRSTPRRAAGGPAPAATPAQLPPVTRQDVVEPAGQHRARQAGRGGRRSYQVAGRGQRRSSWPSSSQPAAAEYAKLVGRVGRPARRACGELPPGRPERRVGDGASTARPRRRAPSRPSVADRAAARQLVGEAASSRSATALSAALAEAGREGTTSTVNPRYRPLESPCWLLGNGQALVCCSLPYVGRTARSPTSPPRSRCRPAAPQAAGGRQLSMTGPDRPAGHLAPAAGRAADRRRLGRRTRRIRCWPARRAS